MFIVFNETYIKERLLPNYTLWRERVRFTITHLSSLSMLISLSPVKKPGSRMNFKSDPLTLDTTQSSYALLHLTHGAWLRWA